MVRSEARAALRGWRAVPFRLRREALRHAKQGRRHPDPVVAAAVVVVAALGLLALAVLDRYWPTGVVAVLVLLYGLFVLDLRRDARRVVAAR